MQSLKLYQQFLRTRFTLAFLRRDTSWISVFFFFFRVSLVFSFKYGLFQIFEQSVSAPDKNVVVYSHPVAEAPSSSTTTRLIDKDDPRSRLHFVKYLKRDGKTLKIWECGICT